MRVSIQADQGAGIIGPVGAVTLEGEENALTLPNDNYTFHAPIAGGAFYGQRHGPIVHAQRRVLLVSDVETEVYGSIWDKRLVVILRAAGRDNEQ